MHAQHAFMKPACAATTKLTGHESYSMISLLSQRVEDDIYRLLDDLKENKSEAARAEAAGLAREFEDIRNYVKENGGVLADEAKAE